MRRRVWEVQKLAIMSNALTSKIKERLIYPHQSPWILEGSFGDTLEEEGRKVGLRICQLECPLIVT